MNRLMLLAFLSILAPAVCAADVNVELLSAVSAGRTGQVADLLAQGADANAKNPAGRPALVLAGFSGNRRTARLLVNAGADVNAVDSAGNTALIAASAFGHGKVVSLLVSAGADPNLKNAAGQSALMRATLSGHTSVVEQLKAAGAVEEAADGEEDDKKK